MRFKTNDRCDLHFTYDWNKTNLFYNVLKSQPVYFLNAGDTLELTLKNIQPDEVYVLFDDSILKLSNEATTLKYVFSSDGKKIYTSNGQPVLAEVSIGGTTGIYNATWGGTIPKDWLSQGDFQVIAKKDNCRLLLWQGLMNNSTYTANTSLDNTIYGLSDSFIQTNSKGITITRNDNGEFVLNTNDDLITSSDNFIKVNNTNGTYDLTQGGKC